MTAASQSLTVASQSLTVRVPLAIQRRGGRKLIITPEGEAAGFSAPSRRSVDSTLVKALARAHRWKHLLEESRYASISELARAEKIDRGYLGRILLLTLLAPDIVEAILDGRMPELSLPQLMRPFPLEWDLQRAKWTIAPGNQVKRNTDGIGQKRSQPPKGP